MGFVEGDKDRNGLHLQERIHVTRHGKVYDVTDFASKHPGGKDLLMKHSGRDVDELMGSADSHVHSKAAYSIMEKYYVGPEGEAREENGNYKSLASSDTYTRPDDFYKNDLVDWDRPIFSQVEKLGDAYFDWTHQQVDWSIRLFESETMEMLSKSKWWLVPIAWLPVVMWSLYDSYNHLTQHPEVWPRNNILGHEFGPMSMPFIFAMGFLIWTILEYVIHRWIFHMRPPGNWPILIRLHFSLHGQHHKAPMDPNRLVFPLLPAAAFALLFYVSCHASFPHGVANSVFAGIVSGYMVYDLTHYYIHHGQPFFDYFKRLKTYHTLHHYEHQQLGFGISSKMWDYPFGTVIPEDVKTK